MVVCAGFGTARDFWRQVGQRVAWDNAPREDGFGRSREPPLLVRLLFGGGDGVDLSAWPAATGLARAPESADAPGATTLRAAFPGPAPAQLALCVSERVGRHCLDGVECHLMTGHYPTGSFFSPAEGVLVAAPELCFLQMTRVLDEVALVLYGYELCGCYSLLSEGPARFVNCPALTSVARIGAYLDRLEAQRVENGEGMPWGLAPARRALALVRDGAASPHEAAVSVLLTFPMRLGGYGLAPAQLNERVRLGAAARHLFGIDAFVCDLAWPEAQLAVEYQGAQHKARARQTYDQRKGNVLAADGWHLVEASAETLLKRDLTDALAKSVARVLGVAWRPRGRRFYERQLRLRSTVLRYLFG